MRDDRREDIGKIVDPKKGEFWYHVDNLRNRKVWLYSLHAKSRYKSILRVEKRIELKGKKYKTKEVFYRVAVKEASTFVINFFSYVNKTDVFLTITFAGRNRQEVKPKLKLPEQAQMFKETPNQVGNPKSEYFQEFDLQPGAYKFAFEFVSSCKSLVTKKEDWLLRVSCTSECKF